jgi:N,N'-diacetyllegionaminate synthase
MKLLAMDFLSMTKLIAETAWHHEGDFIFMKDLVTKICETSNADIVKFHISLDLEEYMSKDHEAYKTLKSWLLSDKNWEELIGIVRRNNKELMLLLNDTKAVDFSKKFNPEYVELHSVSLNVPRLQIAVLENFSDKTKIVIGVGGCSVEEVEEAIKFFDKRETVLMFGFQNYPTKYEDVNLYKIKKMQDLFRGTIFGYADHTAWDQENNELITLLVASNGMNFIEKHVTTEYGKERCDYSAAISIDQLNILYKKIKVLDKLYGDGSMELNAAEQKYSSYGPMKMAALANRNLNQGEELTINNLRFCRTSQNSDMSQIDILKAIGNKLSKDLQANQVICSKHIAKD